MAVIKKSVVISTPVDVGNPQATWDRKKFDDLISDKGYECFIERALKCPCNNTPTGQAMSDCMNCGGTGWFFIDKQKTAVVCQAMSHRTKYEVWTAANMGIVNISTRPQDKLGFMDRVTLVDLESWFSQVLSLKLSATDPTKYFSFLIYVPIKVFEIYIFESSAKPLVYLEVDNYTIDCGSNKILINKTYLDNLGITKPVITIRYTHNPTYHIIDVNRDLIKQKSISNVDVQVVNFPLNCIGKRAHYILDAPNFNGDRAFDNTNYSRDAPKYDY